MVSKRILEFVNERLNQILRPGTTEYTFGNISVLAFGDFYQLPPVLGTSLLTVDHGAIIEDLWTQFVKHDLHQVMRQKDDKAFALLLNRLRTKTKQDDFLPHDLELLSQRFQDTNQHASSDILHLFGTNAEVDAHNSTIMDTFDDHITLQAYDTTQYMNGKIEPEKKPLSFSKHEGCSLSRSITLAVECRIMVIANVDVSGTKIFLLLSY